MSCLGAGVAGVETRAVASTLQIFSSTQQTT